MNHLKKNLPLILPHFQENKTTGKKPVERNQLPVGGYQLSDNSKVKSQVASCQ